MKDPRDRYGLRSLDIERLRAKGGIKWQSPTPTSTSTSTSTSTPTSTPVFSAWVADMDFDVAPAITDALRAVIDRNEFGYPAWGGFAELSPAAKLFAPRQAERYGWAPRDDRLHDLADVIQGVRASVLHLSRPGDGVVLHLPAYHPFLATIDEMDRRMIHVDWTGDGFDYDDLEQRLADGSARIWILCHPHNPLGRVFERAELERIAEIAERHDLVVVSDEIHADLTLPGVRHIPFESLGAEVAARTVTVTSASKAFNLAGLRWAVLHAGHEPMHRALDALPDHYLGAPNLMAVTATVAAWTDGGDWLDAVVDLLDEHRRALPALLDEHLPGASARPLESTYLAWIDCRALGLGDEPAETFRARGVEVSPGSQFSPLGHGAGHIRLNLATSPAIIAATLAAMGSSPGV
jgi:cysteine-S-conjugate beta-lyase